VREPHLDFLTLTARLLEGFSVGESADVLSDVLINIARDFAGDCRGAARLEFAYRAIVRARPVRPYAALVDDAARGEQLAGRADVYVALSVKDEVLSTELARKSAGATGRRFRPGGGILAAEIAPPGGWCYPTARSIGAPTYLFKSG
jgi:hypothetical protein